MRHARNIAGASTWFALVLMILCSALARAAQDPRQIPLVDQRGASFTLAALKGRAVAVTFVASRCSDVCPISNAAFQTLARRLASSGSNATLVTITLDPGYDTPFVMSRVARAMDADPNRWRVASGAPQDVASLMHAFGVTVRNDKAGIPEEHSSFVYVFDRDGRLRRTLLLSTHVVDDAAAALR
jgi:protein SCO1/2